MSTSFPVSMKDVLPLLDIPYPPDRRKFNIQCPCCDDKKRHLNINLQENVFRCPRCGFSGGILDLYAFYSGTNRKQAFKDIRERLHLYIPQASERKAILNEPQTVECPLTDVDTRHATYSALLDSLTLASDHYNNLIARGLSPEIIQAKGYRTMPVVGFRDIAARLLKNGCYLAGVPGFYRDKTETWTFINAKRGILIPVRDLEGRIQALHLRLDDAKDDKFRWISSIDRNSGCTAGSPVHCVGNMRDTVLLTEGVIKADVIHHLKGWPVISIQGVTATSALGGTLSKLKELGVTKIMTAFDMDYMVNPNVQKAMWNLYTLLSDAFFSFGTYIWDPAFKGLDDYLWAKAQEQNTEGG